MDSWKILEKMPWARVSAVLWQGHELSDVATAAVLSFNQLFCSCQQQFGCGAILTAVLTQIAAP